MYQPIRSLWGNSAGEPARAGIEVDTPVRWAFHCHLMYHMATGMFREVVVEDDPEVTLAN